VFLLPFCILVIVASWPFVTNAFDYAETSPDPGGLPYRFVLKAAIPVGFGLLLLQGVASILRAIAVIRGGASPAADGDGDQ
jgi:TRAP-type mannitol/chloroaromatic compound transport system permease small subunit